MKMLWRLSREAIRHKKLYVIAILSTLGLTAVNLAAPLAARGVTLAYPVAGEGGQMEAYVPGGALVPGRFSIPEPQAETSLRLTPEELDAGFVPCAGFDGEGKRLGRGGGYYDRYLLRCPQAAAILTAFEAQRLLDVPREAHDLSFSLLVTEAGVFRH